ncbi:SLAP domain-containing protein [Lactobacillus crispatus]|uniref:SLAP domain-containing protein n=1 Tax=Lactobacillus crispatus TaxID=47770 RepID=UPI00254FCF17|nr:SLAP domain-containing protein [Lactobacillus crispatus]MDK7312455.1 SLAP domain-containing protein [Lactobacillus crispatus]
MKKNVLVSLSVATLLSVGAVGVNEINGVANNTNVVQAAVKNGKLTHNAYIYKSNGNRYGKKVLKKGKTVKILGTKKIYGKKYYRIGKNQYVKVANFAKKTSKANTASGQYYLTHNAYVYNAEGKRIKGTDTLKKNHVFTVVGVKTINGKDYLSLGNGQYVKAANAQSTSAEGANNQVNNNATDTAVGNTTDKSTSNSNNSSENKHNSSDSKSAAEKAGEKGYIYFTDDQVAQIQNYLWQKINAYRQSKGYPAYKTNPELNNFVNRIMQKGTPEYNALGDGIGTFQNTDTLAKFLPKLKALGMDSARSLNDLDAFRYNNVKQHFINLKERDPKKVADEIFNAYTREEDNIDLRTLEGHKDKYAYAALKVKYNGEGDYIDHGLELNFTVVGSYSPEWIKAWEAAK